jgi:hypothetical protein
MNAQGEPILTRKLELHYTTLDSPQTSSPRSSDRYGNLYYNGDAVSAAPGMPGNWWWHVSADDTAHDITTIVLEFPAGFDPNIAFDTLRFTERCLP